MNKSFFWMQKKQKKKKNFYYNALGYLPRLLYKLINNNGLEEIFRQKYISWKLEFQIISLKCLNQDISAFYQKIYDFWNTLVWALPSKLINIGRFFTNII